ncbi:hypothetical protein [Chlorogloeopsis sp. ULAP02]|uniref:hypothetical protein n=1 Tax=Chlorogloeopsis sp. ULAP02 TaxID=3107926 RepID=UPI0031371262
MPTELQSRLVEELSCKATRYAVSAAMPAGLYANGGRHVDGRSPASHRVVASVDGLCPASRRVSSRHPEFSFYYRCVIAIQVFQNLRE